MSGLMHVSLFAGVGGADLGMEAAGIPTVAAVEIDAQARGVLAHRFPHSRLFTDVNEVTGDDLRDAGAVPERTVLSGGFPCQPFSVAGRRKGVDDERGELFWQIDRILSEFPARWVVLENVPGLLSIDSGRTMGTILRDLAERGYGVAYRVLDAQHFGVPQRRRRVFIVGRLGDDRGPVEVLLEPEGGGRDSASGDPSGPGAAETVDGGVDGASSYSMTGVGWWNADEDGVTSTLAAREFKDTARVVVSSLTSNMAGGWGGPDDNTAQAGHLVPYVKGTRAASVEHDETRREDQTSPTLNVLDNGGDSRATVLAVGGTVAHALTAEGHDASEDGTGRGTPIVAFSHTQGLDAQPSGEAWPCLRAQGGGHAVQIAPTLSASNDPSRSPQSAEITAQVEAVHLATSTVRRLTPVECERLMGWPDGHTSHRVDLKTGRVVAQADSHRYKQCGNGMAAPVVAWIARRIVEVES